jgi:kinesin family member 11
MSGLNCTVFAYGQTGTGKTYTMSGDISDQLPLSDDAGIIPRVLHSLFSRIDSLPNSPSSGKAPENSVKVSFIELYNEELRDLLSAEENPKLKISDNDGKRGQPTVLVQGMEEKYISGFHQGIRHLRHGSYKRQVAATKCNDLSSRSHTVFTITLYMKKTLESGEEYLSTGKLNLVDLAGSESIGRSGAENKRAAEAGLINRSLLTLGRVINALVDRSPHIPYRESKLTRLLQDSLGGRTKTCIIATLSPAKSNLLETMSTLDYAFRAKNIRNKPQINQMFSKKTLLKEFTEEIEKLKSELIATRQKNGVFLTQENFDEITNESESRRIQVKEQRERIETMECNLRNKVEELYALTNSFKALKEDNEATRMNLDSTKSLLEQTEEALAYTRRSLEEETFVRQEHEKTETQLVHLSQGLMNTLDLTTSDIGLLQTKLRRRSELHSTNTGRWSEAQATVSHVTNLINARLQNFRGEQNLLVERVQRRLLDFVENERASETKVRQALRQKAENFERANNQVICQAAQSKEELSAVLSEIQDLRDDVKSKVGEGLKDLGKAAERISAGVMTEIELFNTQLHASYSGLGRDFKSTFDDLSREITEQQEEIESLKKQMSEANSRLATATSESVTDFERLLEREQTMREQENRDLTAQIQALMMAQARQQDLRMQEFAQLPSRFKSTSTLHSAAASAFDRASDTLIERSAGFGERVIKSRDTVKAKMQKDFAVSCPYFLFNRTNAYVQMANAHSDTLRSVTASVHVETTRITQEQIKHLDKELHALDDIVIRIQEQNDSADKTRNKSLSELALGVKSSYKHLEADICDVLVRAGKVEEDVGATLKTIEGKWNAAEFEDQILGDLSILRERIESDEMEEYNPTGRTPARTREYAYQSVIPRTEDHSVLMERMRSGNKMQESEDDTLLLALNSTDGQARSPSKGIVFADEATSLNTIRAGFVGNAGTMSVTSGLRELDINTLNKSMAPPPLPMDALAKSTSSITGGPLHVLPPLKRLNTTGTQERKGAKSKRCGARSTVAGKDSLAERENLTMPNLSASVGPGTGRRLRSRDRN